MPLHPPDLQIYRTRRKMAYLRLTRSQRRRSSERSHRRRWLRVKRDNVNCVRYNLIRMDTLTDECGEDPSLRRYDL